MGHLGKIFRHIVRSEKTANKNKCRRNAALLTESFVYLISHLNEIFVVFDVVLFLCRSTTIIVMVAHPNESTVIILTQPMYWQERGRCERRLCLLRGLSGKSNTDGNLTGGQVVHCYGLSDLQERLM
jgi:hypothetical protein